MCGRGDLGALAPASVGLAGRVVFAVMTPVAHGASHGQHLLLEKRAGLADPKVDVHGEPFREAERAIFPRQNQRSNLPASATEWIDHRAGFPNQFSCKHSRRRMRARCSIVQTLVEEMQSS